MTINKADDVSFEELGRNMTRLIKLSDEMEEKKKDQEELLKEVVDESMRLQKQGYDLSELNINVLRKNGITQSK